MKSPCKEVREVRVESPPSRWCGLKLLITQAGIATGQSPPSRWCGLKSVYIQIPLHQQESPPSRWCGLKYFKARISRCLCCVTTFAVVWIEIAWNSFCVCLMESPPSRWCGLKCTSELFSSSAFVTTFAVVWIEIVMGYYGLCRLCVTTFAVVWIEIVFDRVKYEMQQGHHLRGGVD